MMTLTSKNKLTLLSVVLLLVTPSLSTAAVNYCTTGMCFDCQLETVSGDRFCVSCLSSDITTIDGKNAPGGKCEGMIPIEHCGLLKYASGSNKCEFCKPGYQRSANDLVCNKIEIAECVSLKDGNCDRCKKGFFPNSAGDGCKALASGAVVTDCTLYDRTAEGNPECAECKWTHELNRQKTCDSVDRSDSNFCEKKSEQQSGPPVTCSGRCFTRGGYFSSDAVEAPNRRILTPAGLSLTEGSQKCTKNPDFDPENPFGSSSLIQFGLLSFLAFAIGLIFGN